MAGYFSDTIVFGATTLTSAGGSDAFIAELDADGQAVWAESGGGVSSTELVYDLDYGAGRPIICGLFNDNATFGGNHHLTSEGAGDAFIYQR